METEETPPAELPALTNPDALAELVSQLYRKLPASIADDVAMAYAEALIRYAAAEQSQRGIVEYRYEI